MHHYSYKAINADGILINDIIEGEDINAVHVYLSSRGLYILNVKKASRVFHNLQKVYESRKLRRNDFIEFTNNLSVMLRAGIPLFTVLGDMITSIENKYFQKTIADIKYQVEMGVSFSDAIESHKNVFPDILIRLVRVGEETGRLEKSLSDTADHLQKIEDLSQAIKRALMYPVFAIATTTGALIFWLAFVLPKMVVTMKEMGVKLPLITKILIHVSDFTQVYWYLIPIFLLFIFASIKILKKLSKVKYYLDILKIKMPIIKLVVYNKLLALFSEQLRILIMAGLTIDRAFDIVADVIGNEVFRKAILKSKDSIITGSRLSSALREHKLFPFLLLRMVDIGETSGNLDKQFAFLSDHYLKKMDDISQKIGKMTEPIVLIFIGIIFAIMIAGLMLPLYDLISKLGIG